MHKKNIELIITNGTSEDMHEMREVFEGIIDYLKVEEYNMYLVAEYALHCIAHKGHLGETLARKWVCKMKNKDGTCGGHWSWEQVGQVLREKNLRYELSDFYATLNMIYSDNYNAKFDLSTYIELAKDWLDDVDVSEHKLLKYYFFVVCGK